MRISLWTRYSYADLETAERIQLFLEDTWESPFNAGSPDIASKDIGEKASAAIAPMLAQGKEARLRTAHRLKADAT